MYRKSIFVLALVAMGLLSFQLAHAADKGGRKPIEEEVTETFTRSWSGFYFGGTIGYGYATIDAVPSPLAIGAKDWLFGINLGADMQLTKYWVAGVFADYEFPKSQDWDQGFWTVGGRLGYLLAKDTMVYGLGGYSQVWKHSEVDALVAGAGLEQRLGLGWSTKLEYRHHFIDAAGMDMSGDSIRLGVTYKLGAN